MPDPVTIAMLVLGLVERGVITATRARALREQGANWSEAEWTAKLQELESTSDKMFADTNRMLDELIAGGTPTLPQPE